VSRTLRALLLVAGAAVLAVLVSQVGAGVVVDLLRRVGWGFAGVSMLYTAHLAVRAAALWRALPSGLLPYSDVLRVRLASEAIETLTFTGPFLAEPAKGWLLARRGLTGVDAFGGVAIEYLLYTLVSAWMATAALGVLLARGVLPAALRLPIGGVIAVMIAFTIGVVAAAATGVGLIVPMVRAFGAGAGRARVDALAARIDPIERVLVTFMHARPGRLAEVLAIETAGHALLACEIWIVIRALGFAVSPADPFIVEGAVKFISVAFFFVPGQVGASEGVYTLLFSAIGLPGAAGLTMALVRRVRGLIVAGIGLMAIRGVPV
jgi:hypothetical protein